jgi:hypothetical protein
MRTVKYIYIYIYLFMRSFQKRSLTKYLSVWIVEVVTAIAVAEIHISMASTIVDVNCISKAAPYANNPEAMVRGIGIVDILNAETGAVTTKPSTLKGFGTFIFRKIRDMATLIPDSRITQLFSDTGPHSREHWVIAKSRSITHGRCIKFGN